MEPIRQRTFATGSDHPPSLFSKNCRVLTEKARAVSKSSDPSKSSCSERWSVSSSREDSSDSKAASTSEPVFRDLGVVGPTGTVRMPRLRGQLGKCGGKKGGSRGLQRVDGEMGEGARAEKRARILVRGVPERRDLGSAESDSREAYTARFAMKRARKASKPRGIEFELTETLESSSSQFSQIGVHGPCPNTGSVRAQKAHELFHL